MIWQVIAQLNLETCEVISESTSPYTVATRPNALGRGRQGKRSNVLLSRWFSCSYSGSLWWSKADATTDHPNMVRLIQRHSTNSHRFTCTVSQTSRTMATIGSYAIGTDLPNLWTSTVESTLLTSASSLWTCIIPITFKLWLREPCLLNAIQMHMEILHCIEKSL